MSHLYGLAAVSASGVAAPRAEKLIPASAASKRTKYKKAPGAPKRFKSAFIFFSTEKHKEIRKEMGDKGTGEKTTNVAKLVSEAWRELQPEDRVKWEEMAKEDRARYEEERRNYRGPWKIAVSKKPYKDPNAPKRPMSAFLMYSNKRRAAVKKDHADFTNGEISRLLSEMWRAAPDEDRQKYIKEEFELRTKYKENMAIWRKEAEEKEKERIKQQEEEELNAPPHREDMSRLGYSSMGMLAGATGASNPAAAQSYLAAMAGGGTAGYEAEIAMQRARAQLEAEQRARMIQQLGSAASGMDGGADAYARYAAAAFGGQYADMLGGGGAGAAADPYARQLRQEQELRQQQQLLALQEQEHQAAMQMYAQQQQQQQQYYGQQDQQSAAAMLDAYGRSAAYENSLADAAAFGQQQQQQQQALESQLGGYGGGAGGGYPQAENMLRQAFDPRGRDGAGGAGGGAGFGRSP